MRKIFVCTFLLSGLVAFADGPIPAPTNVATAEAPAADFKSGALQIRDKLVAIYEAQKATAEEWNAVDAKIDGYQKRYGVTDETTNVVDQLREMQLVITKKVGGQARFDALVKKLSTDSLPEIAAMAASVGAMEKKMAALKSKPVDLKFTAVDGSQVDLTKLRGKVVLLDFWATWCPPCRDQVPNIVASYQKYHDKGFEIVGISLDQEKDKMLNYAKDNGMTWPQYFDGQGWDNKISTSFNIAEIPAMWLIDKKGMLVTDNAYEDLDGRVAKLLAAH